MAKYVDWITSEGLLQIEGWARDGLTDEQIANNMGIARGTLYDWKKKYPDISDAIKKGKAPVDVEVENALLKNALGYSYDEIKTTILENEDGTKTKRVEKIRRHSKPDTTAQIFWLKNRRKDLWRDTWDIDTSKNIQVIFEGEDDIME